MLEISGIAIAGETFTPTDACSTMEARERPFRGAMVCPSAVDGSLCVGGVLWLDSFHGEANSI
jgi:hypothetical protein